MIISETAGCSYITLVKYLLSEWTLNTKALQAISCTPLETLIPNRSITGLRRLLSTLESKQARLTDQYKTYLYPIRDDDRIGTIILRTTYISYKRILTRVVAFLSLWVENELLISTIDDTFQDPHFHEHITRLCVPSSVSLFHHTSTGLTTLSDIPHFIFMYGLHTHLLRSTVSSPPPLHPPAPTTDRPILCFDHAINNLLDYCALLASYPVIPPAIKGRTIPTLYQHRIGVQLDFTSPGIDSRVHISPQDPIRVCVRCAIQNAIIGFTDKRELSLRAQCRCTSIPGFCGDLDNPVPIGDRSILTKLINRRATTISRLSASGTFSFHNRYPTNLIDTPDCTCDVHQLLLDSAFTDFTRLLMENNLLSDG